MNLSENFVKSIAIDADQVYNNRATKSGRNMQRINPGAGLPETAFKLYHWLEHALEFMGISSNSESTNIDSFGYEYGTQFGEFDSYFYWFDPSTPLTLEANGTYYRDIANGVHYEDFFYNLAAPPYGTGSTLNPVSIKTLFDSNDSTHVAMYTFGIEILSKNDTGEYSYMEMYDNGLDFTVTNNNDYRSDIYLDDTDVVIRNMNNITSKFSSIELQEDLYFATLNQLDANSYFRILNFGVNSQNIGMFANNVTQSVNASLVFKIDPSDAVHPVILTYKGAVPSYANLAAAITAGLSQGDIFRIGETLNIVP
jgi:hypothetical protein